MLLEGLHIPLTTPFHSDGRLNLRKLASNVVRYSKTPASGLIVLGPSGEPTLLSDEETRETLRAAAEAAAPEKVLIAGISRDSLHATLELANFAAELGYDAVLAGVPSVLAASADRTRELLIYFQSFADRSPLAVILLSANTRNLAMETVAELAAHPNIIGLLDTQTGTRGCERIVQCTSAIHREVTVTTTFAAVTARMKKAATPTPTLATLLSANALTGVAAAIIEPPALRTRTKTVGFQIIASHTQTILDGLRSGASTVAPACAACAPQACYEVFAAWKDDDQALAEEKQARLREAAAFAEALGPGGLKFACDLNGYFGGTARLPHLPPTGEQRAELQRLMQPLRN